MIINSDYVFLIDRFGSMPHQVTMTAWIMHWKLVSRYCLTMRSCSENLSLSLNLVSIWIERFFASYLKYKRDNTGFKGAQTLNWKQETFERRVVFVALLESFFPSPCSDLCHQPAKFLTFRRSCEVDESWKRVFTSDFNYLAM